MPTGNSLLAHWPPLGVSESDDLPAAAALGTSAGEHAFDPAAGQNFDLAGQTLLGGQRVQGGREQEKDEEDEDEGADFRRSQMAAPFGERAGGGGGAGSGGGSGGEEGEEEEVFVSIMSH